MRHQSISTIPTRRQDKYEKSNVTIRVKVGDFVVKTARPTFTTQNSRYAVHVTRFTARCLRHDVHGMMCVFDNDALFLTFAIPRCRDLRVLPMDVLRHCSVAPVVWPSRPIKSCRRDRVLSMEVFRQRSSLSVPA